MKMGVFRKNAFEYLIDIIYPAKCMFCKSHLGEHDEYGICGECLSGLPYTKNEGCFETIGGAAYLIAPLMYEGIVKNAIRDLKFRAKHENADALSMLICGYIRNNLQAMGADVIVNVPLSKKSLLRRGFNQTELIAQGISRRIGIKHDNEALIKVRETKRQSTLATFEQRAKNISGAYKCQKDMNGKTVLLVDDVYTSGATIYYCAQELIKNGASKVIAVVAANAHKDVGYSTHNYKASRLVFENYK